jgi:hypothetical protein
MGDRYDRSISERRRQSGGMKPPELILTWGLAKIGHNGGPPLNEPVNDLFVHYRWRKAHREAWQTPSMSILKFRMARAEAAGVSYRDYMLELLDSGRHLQKEDIARRKDSA